jgi:hypothetical protein
MNRPMTASRKRDRRLTALAILVSTLLGTPVLACQNPSFAGQKTALQPTPEARPVPADAAEASLPAEYSLLNVNGFASVVGMWHATLRIGDEDGLVFDEVLEQFHSDGTELLISQGLPPALGNVCIGIWKRIGARTYKLRHMTWNWSPPDGGFGVPGTFAGHFELNVTLRLNPQGTRFTGTWTAQNFDPQGEHIPALDAEGVVTAVRLTVD